MHNKIVLGKSLSSLLYCWRTQTRCLMKERPYVFRHDMELRDFDFSPFKADNPKHFLDNLIFAMSFTGLLLQAGNVSSIRQEGEGINVITKGNRRVSYKADEIIDFDREIDLYGVHDFFDIKQMSRHDGEEILDDDDFVSQINFYPSIRNSNTNTFDLVGTSTMTLEQSLDPDLGHGIAKIKILRMLKSAGLKGPYAMTYKDKRYYKKPKIQFHKRIKSQKFESLYSFGEVYNMEQIKGEPWKTLETLLKKEGT